MRAAHPDGGHLHTPAHQAELLTWRWLPGAKMSLGHQGQIGRGVDRKRPALALGRALSQPWFEFLSRRDMSQVRTGAGEGSPGRKLMAHPKRVTEGVAAAVWGAPYLQGAGEVLGPRRPEAGRPGARLPLERKRGASTLTAALPPPPSFWLAKPHCHLTPFNPPSSPRGSLEKMILILQTGSFQDWPEATPAHLGRVSGLPGAESMLREAGQGRVRSGAAAGPGGPSKLPP